MKVRSKTILVRAEALASGFVLGVPPAWAHHGFCGFRTYQSLFYEEAEQDGVAHLSEALKHVCFELCILDDVLQLVVEEFQDPWQPQGERGRASGHGYWLARY